MLLDSAIIGGGPAGLSAALVLGRARRNIILFDNNKPRNAVTHESHGFITRDGTNPGEFRQIAHDELSRYPSIEFKKNKVTSVTKNQMSFDLITSDGEKHQSKTIIISSGLKDVLPDIDNISKFYGKSLFNCPYCDGWELRDRPLVVIIEDQKTVIHYVQTVYNWSKDLVVCTNGKVILDSEQKRLLQRKGIKVMERRIKGLVGQEGLLEQIVFEDGETMPRKNGFVLPQMIQSSGFGKQLGCANNLMGGIATDSSCRTNIQGVYAAGDASVIAPSQLIYAAAGGSRAAVGVNTDLMQQEFSQ
jgi:thioredoxin reductase